MPISNVLFLKDLFIPRGPIFHYLYNFQSIWHYNIICRDSVHARTACESYLNNSLSLLARILSFPIRSAYRTVPYHCNERSMCTCTFKPASVISVAVDYANVRLQLAWRRLSINEADNLFWELNLSLVANCLLLLFQWFDR